MTLDENSNLEDVRPAPQIDLLGYRLDRISMPALLEWCLAQKEPRRIVTLNLNYLTLTRKIPEFARVVKNADMTVADAMPLVRVSSWLNKPFPEKITGHDLVEKSAECAAEHSLGVFLLGAGPGVAEAAANALAERYPGLRVMGTQHGGFDAQGVPEEKEALLSQIHEFNPHFLFVALGAPKQDYFLAKHLDELNVPVTAGIGCVFDVLAGRLNRAPIWMQNASLEWLFQMLQEPGRLWKRFILGCIPTAIRLLWDVAKSKVRMTFGG